MVSARRAALLMLPITGAGLLLWWRKQHIGVNPSRIDPDPAGYSAYPVQDAHVPDVAESHEYVIAGSGLDSPPVDTINDAEAAARFQRLIGMDLKSPDGGSIGKIEGIYYRRLSGRPEWALAAVGLIDKQLRLVPLEGASFGDDVTVLYTEDQVENAPAFRDLVLDEYQEHAAYQHFGLRRQLPGSEEERDSEGVKLRFWPPP